MKNLHYILGLPPVRGGGLVKYALDLAEGEARLGHEVSLLVPGCISPNNPAKSSIILKNWKQLPCYFIQNPLPVTGGKGIADVKCLYQRGDIGIYFQFLKECNPDIIHVHSFMGLHIAFLEAAKQLNIPVVYTTHDYYGLCPSATLLCEEKICSECNWDNCAECQSAKVTYQKLIREQSDAYRKLKSSKVYQWLEHSQKLVLMKIFIRSHLKHIKTNKKENENTIADLQTADYERLRQYYREMFGYVTRYHFNSTQTKEVFTTHLGEVFGRVEHISNQNIADRRRVREYNGTLKMGFIGSDHSYKGFPILKKALDVLYQEGIRDFECHVYFNPKEKSLPYLKHHAPYVPEEMDKVYASFDVVILPSICQETFGMVVLEALSYGVPVIISENVGARDIIKEHEGIGIVVAPSEDALEQEIRKLYEHRDILKDMNRAIIDWKKDFAYERHIEDMLAFYEESL